MFEAGANSRYIQAMLGYADLSTTQIYTQVSIRKLKEVHSRTHPTRLHRRDQTGGVESDDSAAAGGSEPAAPEVSASPPAELPVAEVATSAG